MTGLMDEVDERLEDEAVKAGSYGPVSPFCSCFRLDWLTCFLTSRFVQQRNGIVPGI